MQPVFDVSKFHPSGDPIAASNEGVHSDTDPYSNYDLGTGDYTVSVVIRATASTVGQVGVTVQKGKPFQASGPGSGGWLLWVAKNTFGISCPTTGMKATASAAIKSIPVDLFEGWHHIAVTRKDGVLHAFVDFVECTIVVESGSVAGSMSGGGAYYDGAEKRWIPGVGMSVGAFPGQLCLMTLWTCALLGNDLRVTVVDPVNATDGSPQASLIGYWPLAGDGRDLSRFNKRLGLVSSPDIAFVNPGSSVGADKNGSLKDAALGLAACRYAFAMRYLNDYDGRVAMTPAEASALCNANLSIGSIWEPSTSLTYFTREQGAADAAAALRAAQDLGQTSGSAIYFAVDFDVTTAQYASNIKPYFEGIQNNLGGYTVGAYGSGFVLQSLLNDGLAVKTWLSNSYGWTGYDDFKGKCDLLQSSLSVDPYVADVVCGVEIDINTITPGHVPFLWTVSSATGWESFSGGMSGTPAVANRGQGRLDALVVNSLGTVWHARWEFGRLLYWEAIGEGATGSPAVAAWKAASGEIGLVVLCRFAGGDVRFRTFDGNAWSAAWKSVGVSAQNDPVIVPRGLGHLDLFVVGAGRKVTHQAFDGSAWSPADNLGGNVGGNVAAASWGEGRLDVFYRDFDDASLKHASWGGGPWSGWEGLGGALTSDPSVVAPAPNALNVFVRGQDGALWHKRWNGSTWVDWKSLGGGINGAPVAVSRSSERIDVFASGNGDAVWRMSWYSDAKHDWDCPGGSTKGIAAISWSAGRVDVIVRASDDSVWHWWSDDSLKAS